MEWSEILKESRGGFGGVDVRWAKILIRDTAEARITRMVSLSKCANRFTRCP